METLDCILIFFCNRKLLKHWSLKLKLGLELCVYMCFSATLIILFIFQNTADLHQALVQPSRAQPLSTEPWDSSLPTEMTGTSSIPTDRSLITQSLQSTHKPFSLQFDFKVPTHPVYILPFTMTSFHFSSVKNAHYLSFHFKPEHVVQVILFSKEIE